jgi:hypothetical protein
MKTKLITREGYTRLKQEHDFLWRRRGPMSQKVAWAASLVIAARMPITSTTRNACGRSTAGFATCASASKS